MGDCFGDVFFLKPLDDALVPILFTFGHPLGDLLEPWEEVATSYLHLHVDVL